MCHSQKALFITGTDTDVGKTMVAALLFAFLHQRGEKVLYQKWVSTGSGTEAEDFSFCCRAANLDPAAFDLDLHVPCRFALPASPHLAAEREGRAVDLERIVASFDTLRSRCDLLLVEGAGGLLVPLRRDLLLGDFLARFRLPTLVVARTGLGTLNHTLLTIEALRRRQIPILGVVLNDARPDENELLAADNARTIAETAGLPVFGRLPRLPAPAGGKRSLTLFAPIGEAILEALRRFGG